MNRAATYAQLGHRSGGWGIRLVMVMAASAADGEGVCAIHADMLRHARGISGLTWVTDSGELVKRQMPQGCGIWFGG